MALVKYGTLEVPGVTEIQVETVRQEAEAVRQGYAGRSDRLGARENWIATKHKGLGAITASEASVEDLLKTRSNNGVWLHQAFGGFLPPNVVTQAALDAVDISGFRAANKRVFQVLSTLGQSKIRPYYFLGTNMYRSTSDSDASLADTGNTWGDIIRGAFEGKANSTRYIFVTSDGTANDVLGIADPSSAPTANSLIFALASGDSVWGGGNLPNMGGGFNWWYGKINGVSGIHYTKHTDALLTAPKPVVLASTKDVANPNATVQSQAKHARHGITFASAAGHTEAWLFPERIVDDGQNARADASAVTDGNGQWLLAIDYGFTLPSSATVVGLVAVNNRFQENAVVNTVDQNVQLFQGLAYADDDPSGQGSITLFGEDKADRVTEWTESAADKTYGSSTNLWGANLTPTILNRADFGIGHRIIKATDNGANGSLTASWLLTAYYRTPGIQAGSATAGLGGGFGLGGFVVGPDPLDPNIFYVVAPEFQDELTTVNVPRVLWRLTFEYDAIGDRPVVTIDKVALPMSHVETANFGAGGIVAFGDTSAGLGKVGWLSPQNGIPINLGFNTAGQGYTENWGVVNTYQADRYILVDACTEDGLIAQWWLWTDGAWNPVSPRTTTTKLPIGYGGAPMADQTLRRRVRFRPATTNVAVDITRQPRNMMMNPLRNDTAEIKANGPLPFELPDMDMLGPAEANKSLLTIWCLTRDVSSTNTIKVEYSTNGGSSFTTWTTFTAYGAKATLATPVLFRTVIIKISLDHTADSANTPNCFPLLIEGVASFRPFQRFSVLIDPTDGTFQENFHGGVLELISDLQSVVNTNGPASTLKYGNNGSVMAEWENGAGSFRPGPQLRNEVDTVQASLVFREVPQ